MALSRRLGGCGSSGCPVANRMKRISYSGYRFPPAIIQQAIWLYVRFTLSLRDVEDLLAERGIAVSYESIRRWINHFGPAIAADLRRRRPKPHTGFDTLLNKERKRPRAASFQATAARQVSIATARKPRCVDAEVRWRWMLKVL